MVVREGEIAREGEEDVNADPAEFRNVAEMVCETGIVTAKDKQDSDRSQTVEFEDARTRSVASPRDRWGRPT